MDNAAPCEGGRTKVGVTIAVNRTLWTDDHGQDLTEYALLLGGIVLAMLGAVAELEDAIRNLWTTMDSRLQTPGA